MLSHDLAKLPEVAAALAQGNIEFLDARGLRGVAGLQRASEKQGKWRLLG